MLYAIRPNGVGVLAKHPVQKFKWIKKNFIGKKDFTYLFYHRYSKYMNDEELRQVNIFIKLFSQNRCTRLKALLKFIFTLNLSCYIKFKWFVLIFMF